MLAIACGPSVSSSEQHGASGGASGGSSSGAGLSSSTGSPSSSSSTGEPPLEGPGCGDPPPCDRGTFEGHALIESEADLAQFEGYTEVTGFLQIAGSEDLVCLDRLACLEVVGRDVRIQQNAVLESTAGLRNVREIGAATFGVTPYLYVAENAALEILEGFGPEAKVPGLVLWRNPVLTDVLGFESSRMRELTALDNPRLAALTSLHGLEHLACHLNSNTSLCSAEVEAVCSRDTDEYSGDHSHIYYGAECPEGPASPVDYPSDADCSLQVDDCPRGEKCIPIASHQGKRLECSELVAQPRALGEPCQYFGEADFDPCGPRAACDRGECTQLAFGEPGRMVCPSLDQSPTTESSGFLNFCVSNCDPLADECTDGRLCVPWTADSFVCMEPRDDPPVQAGEPCGWVNSCADGLACTGGDFGGTGGELDEPSCGELCDMNAPNCAGGRECVSWWEDDDRPLPKVEHVGLCVDP